MKETSDSEVAKFSKLSSEWWDGKSFALLRKINPLRVEYILSQLNCVDFTSISLVDIGCGGGLLTEPMSRLGMHVSGIDPSKESIEVAKNHAHTCGLDIRYYHSSLAEIGTLLKGQYDVVTIMEVVEHVEELSPFLEDACNLLRQGGMLFISTLNRTMKSKLFGIIIAEYIVNWVPRGTHRWNKFPRPSEVSALLRKFDCLVQDIRGISYNVFIDAWHLSSDISVNYVLTARKL